MLLVCADLLFAQPDYDRLLNSLKINVTEVSPSGSIHVDVINVSQEPLRIWSEAGSFGAARWRVLRIRNGQLEAFFQHPNQEFTRNANIPVEIPAKGHMQEKLDLNGGNWCGYGHCAWFNERGFAGRKVSFEPGDIIVVTYDVPRTDLASKAGVWYGVTASSTTVR